MGGVFEVSRGDLSRTRVVAAGPGEPREGEVLFEVERFGFSANNVTYALLGEAARYWDLFPAEPGWGRVPAWGYLRAVASAVPGIEPGRRALGLVPMGTRVLLRAGRVRPGTFTEQSAHRSGLSSVYNVYSWADGAGTDSDDALLVLRPVFWLSFMLDDYLAGRPPAPVIVTSASSKAALGLAWLLRRRGIPVTGLTGHADFAARHYDQVLGYDEIEALAPAGAVLVDIAGNPAVRDRVSRRLGGWLAGTVVAGRTHQGSGEPRLFSAPQRITDRAGEWGWATLEQRFSAALGEFARSATWLHLDRARGLDGAARVYQQVLANAVQPDRAHLIEPEGAALSA
jgi:hypothetical protein